MIFVETDLNINAYQNSEELNGKYAYEFSTMPETGDHRPKVTLLAHNCRLWVSGSVMTDFFKTNRKSVYFYRCYISLRNNMTILL